MMTLYWVTLGTLAVIAVYRRLPGRWQPGQVLIRWSRSEDWTLRDAYEGTLVLGATGSGKTSGSGRAIAAAMLKAGFGAFVLTAKAEERQLWERYCRQTRRRRDLIVFGPRQRWRFNFLDYELNRAGAGAGQTENIVNLFSTVMELAERNTGQGGSGRDDEGYWRRASRQLCRNLVDLLVLATGRVSIPELHRLAMSAPTSKADLRSKEWQAKSFCCQCLLKADDRKKTPQQDYDFDRVSDYWMVEFPELSERTRSVIVSTFTSLIDVLNRGVLRELFCGETNITPEAVEKGRIVLIDLPVKEYGEVGQIAQAIWKFCFQRSIERRDIRKSPRPVTLWADEAHFFANAYDMQFQTTCRASRAATVYLSQNISNFYATIGGKDAGKALTDSLVANLCTRIFHANGDPVTNTWAAELIGRTRQFFVNANNNYAADGGSGWFGGGDNRTTSAGVSEQMEYEVQPAAFSRLKTGGRENRLQVQAVVVQNGRTYSDTGRTWRVATFSQR
jgi:hypothetical protein